MTIRRYKSQDAHHISGIFDRSVREIGPAFYSSAQVEAWAGLAPSPSQIHIKCTDGRAFLVAVDEEDLPVAFGDIESDGHIDVLYCSPESAGRGITSSLYDELEKVAANRRLPRIYVEASEAAKPLFTKKGFQVQARRELSIGDVPIHNYAMEKIL